MPHLKYVMPTPPFFYHPLSFFYILSFVSMSYVILHVSGNIWSPCLILYLVPHISFHVSSPTSYLSNVSSLIFSASCLMSYHISCIVKSYVYSHGIKNVYPFIPYFVLTYLLCHCCHISCLILNVSQLNTHVLSNDLTSLFSHTVSHLIIFHVRYLSVITHVWSQIFCPIFFISSLISYCLVQNHRHTIISNPLVTFSLISFIEI